MAFTAGQVLTAAQLNDFSTDSLGVGTTSPETPINIVTTNKLGSTFTGTTDGEGLRVDQSNYTANNFVSLVEASYQDDQTEPHVRMGAQFTSGGSKLAFGTSNSYGSGITNQALTIDASGRVGIGEHTPESILHLSPGTDQTPDANGVGHIMIDGNSYTSFFTMDGTGTWIGNNAATRSMILATNETARLTVAGDGDVGIGTTSPGQRFHVNSGNTNTTSVFESTDSIAYIGIKDSDSSSNIHVAVGAIGDELRLRAGNVNIVTGETNGTVKANTGDFYAAASGKTMLATSPPTGTGNDAEWAAPLGIYILRRNSSLTAEKENISADLGTHLTADMIDSVVPKMWNRINAPGYPEIGPLAEDMDAISPFLAARGTTAQNVPFLTGINKTAYLSLLVLAVKDLRTRVAALEA